MNKSSRVAGNSASKAPSRKPRSAATKKKNVLNSMFLQARLSGGKRLGIDMPLWADHEIEAKYIADIAKNITKAQEVPMVAFYNDIQRKLDTSGSASANHELVDSDGNIIALTDEMYSKMVADAEAQDMGEAPGVYQRKGAKRKDYDAEYGRVLGWVNWFFVQKDGDSYRLLPAPRGTALRAKLPGHWDLHKDLRVFHGYGRLFKGRAVWMDSTKNDHIETKAGYHSNVFGG